jgi:hypothetical protein
MGVQDVRGHGALEARVAASNQSNVIREGLRIPAGQGDPVAARRH